MRPYRRTRAGFTLVEVLVALTIMAVLAGLAWRGIDSMVRTRDQGRVALDRSVRLNTVLAQWEQDLMAVHDTTVVPALAFDGQSLRLVRKADGGVRMVVWSLREGSWQRWAGPITHRVTDLQDSWMRSQQLLGNEAEQVRLFTGVSEWQVYFYIGNAWANPQSTGNVAVVQPPSTGASAPTQQRTLLPDGVRLVVKLDGQALTRDIELGPRAP